MRRIMRREQSVFPDPRTADATGLVTVTEHLDADLLLEAYSRGIFPWSERPVRWYSPDPRSVFLRGLIRLPRRVGRLMRKQGLRVSFDSTYTEVMRRCAMTHRSDGIWITPGFVRAYGELHERGFAHSVEVWQDADLVGGLYGVQLGGLFAGESMFHLVPNASKVAFAHLVAQLDLVGTVLFDCQVINDHTARLGAVCISRDDYLAALASALRARTRFAGEKWPPEPPPPAKREPDAEPDSEAGEPS
jgi:leucyl/phenylalanyl-tRNA--protein transferase